MSIFQSGTDPALLLMSTPIHDRKALSGTGDGGPCDSRDRPAPDRPAQSGLIGGLPRLGEGPSGALRRAQVRAPVIVMLKRPLLG